MSGAAARALAATLLVGIAAPARADRVVWRMATSAPDGTAWARELRAFARDVESGSEGEIAVKWYFGSITGDEAEAMARIGKQQLDGIAAGVLCQRVAPSMRLYGVPGLIEGRQEANYLSQKLAPRFAAEAQRNGFTMLFTSGLGSTIVFSRTPVRTMEELRAVKLWRWELDESGVTATRAMGLPVFPASIDAAGRLYRDGRVDGFTTMPAAALAFQWSTQARYITDLPIGYLQGCMLLANRVWDRASERQRQVVMAAAAKCAHRFEEVGKQQDEQLLGGLFERQGLKRVVPSSALRAQYFEAARAARERLGDKLLPRALLDEAMRILADYRAER